VALGVPLAAQQRPQARAEWRPPARRAPVEVSAAAQTATRSSDDAILADWTNVKLNVALVKLAPASVRSA